MDNHYEVLATTALCSLQARGWIESFNKSRNNTPDDRAGIDFIVYLNGARFPKGDKKVLLQIKGYTNKAKPQSTCKFKNRHQGKRIALLRIKRNASVSEVVQRLIRLFERRISPITKGIPTFPIKWNKWYIILTKVAEETNISFEYQGEGVWLCKRGKKELRLNMYQIGYARYHELTCTVRRELW